MKEKKTLQKKEEVKPATSGGDDYKTKYREELTKLDLLMLSEKQDVEAFLYEDFERKIDFKTKYQDFYDDVKQKSKYIKEDW